MWGATEQKMTRKCGQENQGKECPIRKSAASHRSGGARMEEALKRADISIENRVLYPSERVAEGSQNRKSSETDGYMNRKTGQISVQALRNQSKPEVSHFIERKKMNLRNCTIDDALILHKEIGCNPEMKRYTGWDPYGTLESTAGFITHVVNSTDDYLWIIEKDGEAVGQIGAFDYNEEEQSIEIGYSIFQKYWGRGHALQAVAAACETLFSSGSIKSIKAWSARENLASAKALELNGFKATEIAESALNINGETFDQIFYERSVSPGQEAVDKNFV